MGRKPKFTQDVLKNIIHQYCTNSKSNKLKLSYTNLAKYGQELGYNDLRYYHFERNIEIKSMIEEYNEQLDKTVIQFTNDQTKLINLDINEFVKNNQNNPRQLKFFLSNLQESIRNIYNERVSLEIENEKLKFDISELKVTQKRNKEKIEKLEKENAVLQENNKILENSLGLKEENQLMASLNTTGIYNFPVSDKEVMTTNLKKLDEDNGKNLENIFSNYPNLF